MTKFQYVLFVVSDGPIDATGINPKDVRHFIETQVAIGSNPIGGWKIEQPIPKSCRKDSGHFIGKGIVISEAILNWLRSICKSISYYPLYRQREDITNHVGLDKKTGHLKEGSARAIGELPDKSLIPLDVREHIEKCQICGAELDNWSAP